jgi:hypothetical protein
VEFQGVLENSLLRSMFGAKAEDVNTKIENVKRFIMRASLFSKYY